MQLYVGAGVTTCMRAHGAVEILNVTSQTWLNASDFQTPIGHVWW